jgi:predicted DNA-binding ribbon-helix-helix protein
MKSLVVKRSIVRAGHKTSISLEEAFWKSLKEIATQRDSTLSALVAAIDVGRRHSNLSSAIRLFVLNYYREEIAIWDRRKAIQEPIDRPGAGAEKPDDLDTAGPR